MRDRLTGVLANTTHASQIKAVGGIADGRGVAAPGTGVARLSTDHDAPRRHAFLFGLAISRWRPLPHDR
jgi:hypothetical protein